MALEIKAIPTLKGKEAERFVKEADKAYQKKEKTDFSKQVKIARAYDIIIYYATSDKRLSYAFQLF